MNSTTLKVLMTADPAGIVKGFAEADTAGKKFAASLNAITNAGRAVGVAYEGAVNKIESAGKKVRNWGIGLSLSAAGAVKSASDVQGALLNVSTVSDFVSNNMGKTTKAVVDLSTRLPLSAADIARGLYDVASSGFAGAEGLNVAATAAKAGVAGLSSTASAARSVTAVMNAYGMTNTKSRMVSDLLFQTVNLGVVTFEELSGVIGDSVGMASQAGVSFKELGGAIATMTLSGVSAAEAGTSVNMLMRSFIDPSESLAATMKSVGLESGAAALKQQGLYKTMMMLNKIAQGNIETFVQWFPEIRAARGALALVSGQGQNYTRIMRQMGEATSGQGATQRAFARQMTGLGAQMKVFFNNLKAVGIDFGSVFLGPFTSIVRAGSNAFRFLRSIVNSLRGVLGHIPEPLLSIVKVVGMLVPMMLTLAGAWAAWRASALVTNGVIRLTTALFSGLFSGLSKFTIGPISAAFQTLSLGVQRLGQHVRASYGVMGTFKTSLSAMGMLGRVAGRGLGSIPGVLGKIGSGLQKASALGSKLTAHIGGMAKGIGAAAGMALAFGMAWQSAGAKADERVSSITSKLDQRRPFSIMKTMEELNNQLDKSRAKLSEQRDGIGGMFGSIAKSVADIGGGLVGIEVDSPIDTVQMINKSEGAIKELKRLRKNWVENAEAIWQSADPKHRPKKLFFDSKEMDQVAAAATKADVDLSEKQGKHWDTTKQKATQALQEIRSAIGQTDQEILGVGQVSVEQIKKNFSEVSKAQRAVVEAYKRSTDAFGQIDVKAGNIRGQLSTFYNNTLYQAGRFYKNINLLAAKGLDPNAIVRLMTMPLEQAGPIAEAIVSDTSGNIIKTMNTAQAALDKIQTQMVMRAALIKQATQSPTKAANLPEALAIQDEIQRQGKLASAKDVADRLGMPVDKVKYVANMFKLDFFREWKGLTPGTWTAGAAGELKTIYDTVSAFTKIGPQAGDFIDKIKGMFDAGQTGQVISEKSLRDAERFINTLNLAPADKQLLYKIVYDIQFRHNADARTQMFMEYLQTHAAAGGKGAAQFIQGNIDYLVSLRGDPDAPDKIAYLAAQAGLGPRSVQFILALLGMETTDKGVKAIVKGLDKTHKKHARPKVTLLGRAKSELDHISNKLQELRNSKPVDLVVNVVQNVTKNSKGNNASGNFIPPGFSFARGGEYHQAQIAPAGAWRVWAETETGGEAYIPLGRSKRRRSMQILQKTAAHFGKQVYPMATGAYDPDKVYTPQQITYIEAMRQAERERLAASSKAKVFQVARYTGGDVKQIAKTWQDVKDAAGEAAANQLLNSGLVGDAFDEAAQKIIENADKAKQKVEEANRKAQDMFDTFSGAIKDLADATRVFGRGDMVTPQMIKDYYQQQVDGAKMFQTTVNQLAAAGLDQGLLQDILRQGPEALTFAQALQQGGADTISFVNQSIKDLNAIGTGTGLTYASMFNPTSAGNIVVPVQPSYYGAPTGTVSVTMGNLSFDLSGNVDPGVTPTKQDIVKLLTSAFSELVSQVNAGV